MERLHPDLWLWIVEFLYGQVTGRTCARLSLADRELASLGCMAGLANGSQLGAHMRGALNCGASPQAVRGILDQCGHAAGRPMQAFVDGYWLSFVRTIPSKELAGAR